MVDHKPWCWRSWTPVATTGGVYSRGPRKGLAKIVKRSRRCNCGASKRARRKKAAAE